jgi:hypothetical protein
MPKKLKKTIHPKLGLNGKIENKLKFYKKIKNKN